MGALDSQLSGLKPSSEVTGVDVAGPMLGTASKAQIEEYLEKYEVARRVLVAFNEEPEDELPADIVSNARNFAERFLSAISAFEKRAEFDPGGAMNEISALPGITEEVLRHLRPQIRGGTVSWADELATARRVLESAESTRADVAELVATTKEIAERTGTGQLAEFYAEEARTHGTAASRWLGASAFLLLGLIGVGFWLYEGTPTDGKWQEYATAVGAKVFIVGAISYGLVFTTRAYRNNKHLQAVYRQRSAALDTYTLMAKSLTDEQGRGIVLTKLAEAIFAPSDTGMTPGGTGDKTIVETTVPLLGALQAQQR